MWVYFLCKGVIVGLVASIPLGPIGVLCVQRTISKNRRSGFVSGLGAASVDFIFASVAAFFLTFVVNVIEDYVNYIKIIGGIIVIILGVNIFLKNPIVQIRRNRANKGSSLWSDFITVFFITLANPAFILMFVALFAAFGVSSDGLTHFESMMLVCGVFIGASLWWFTLTFLVNMFRKKFRPRHLLILNRTSGLIIVALGTAAIFSLFINTPIDKIVP